MNKSSFTTASTFPTKILANPDIIYDALSNNIKPIHVQLNPTNKCNLNCSYCSCKNRNDSIMSIDDAYKIIDKFKALGTKAFTITGGGEPLSYPYLKDLIHYITKNEMCVGLTTNGILFKNIDPNILESVTWCRISVSDEQYLRNIDIQKVLNDTTDFAFSYVLNKPETNIKNLVDCIEYANNNGFTHVRIVDDILGEESKMEAVRQKLNELNVDDHLVIYQGRKTYSSGNKKCLISLLKPNIDADGNFLPCCGVQYAKKDTVYDFDKNMIMNNDKSFDEIYKEQSYFDGSYCDICYYSEYNDILNIIWHSQKLQHKSFI